MAILFKLIFKFNIVHVFVEIVYGMAWDSKNNLEKKSELTIPNLKT